MITGHTGFKGTWLSSWLLSLGAKVYGFSRNTPVQPSMYSAARIGKHIESYSGDILDTDALCKVVGNTKPDIIFHLAAQPITSIAHQNPLRTFETNVMGTASVLEAVRQSKEKCTLVNITSDNRHYVKELNYEFKGTDVISGKDPYSASKSGAEVVIDSYYNTYFSKENEKRVAVARSSNIIGGGDWGQNRILPDCVRAWKNAAAVAIRSPNVIRPWQHVIEPTYGYLLLGMSLYNNGHINGDSFNFGPNTTDVKSVFFIANKFSNLMEAKGINAPIRIQENAENSEHRIFMSSCEKTTSILNWTPMLNIDEALELTSLWYFEGYWNDADILPLTQRQIADFEQKLNQTKKYEAA